MWQKQMNKADKPYLKRVVAVGKNRGSYRQRAEMNIKINRCNI